MRRLFSSFVVPVRNGSFPSFAHKKSCEQLLGAFPAFKAGSLEVLSAEGHLFACVGVDDDTAIRSAVADGVRALQSRKVEGEVQIVLEDSAQAREAAEGATLGTYTWSMKKEAEESKVTLKAVNCDDRVAWREGTVAAQAEAEARTLVNLPANVLTPRAFCESLVEKAKTCDNMEVQVFEEHQLVDELGMTGLKVVGQGSAEPIRMLQLIYRGNPASSTIDVALVGKGVTFDSGGISIKPSLNMGDMKGDMGGAAATAMATIGLARLRRAVNVVCVVPLVENMPSGTASRPGDIYFARNGLSVEVGNTDAEGRLILADALHYAAQTFQPSYLIDVATLTGAVLVALGDRLFATFTPHAPTWHQLQAAGEECGQPTWRLPLGPGYTQDVKSDVADLSNTGKGRAGSCTAAAFLQHFIDDHPQWAHLDIAGTMQSSATKGELSKGMTGSPTRTLIRFAEKIRD